MAQRLTRCRLVGAALAALAWTASAQGLTDPTRPPSAGPGAAEAEPQAGGPRLQSILLSSERKIAVIDGRSLRVGDRVGDATLVQISEGGVLLRRGNELHTLALVPGVAKKAAAPRPPAGEKETQR